MPAEKTGISIIVSLAYCDVAGGIWICYRHDVQKRKPGLENLPMLLDPLLLHEGASAQMAEELHRGRAGR